MVYKELPFGEIIKDRSINFLILTVTKIETQALHAKLADYKCSNIIKTTQGGRTYYIGQFGSYNIVHTQCMAMGAVSKGSSMLTATNAISDWPNIKAAIMVGICFGINDKQQIGDVLVTESIIPYGPKRVGQNAVIQRGTPIIPNGALLSAFKNLQLSWEYFLDETNKANIEVCPLLSGEELIDNIEHRDNLLQENPTARGGEMEGYGFGNACDSKGIPWILVKAICDYADGNKGKDKEQRQKIAASTAVSCCLEALNMKFAFSSLGIDIQNDTAGNCICPSESKNVLFDVYNGISKEPYYIERDVDAEITSILEHKGVWIYGDSGVGKTTSIFRNLIKNSKDFHLINMATCIDLSVDDFFKEIYQSLKDYLSATNIQIPSDFKECIKVIVEMLDSHYPNKEFCIVIEELPFEDGDAFRKFIKIFNSLVITIQGKTSNIKFILSSLASPLPAIPSFQEKVKQNVHFKEMNKWTKEECLLLINMISSQLHISIDSNIKETLPESLSYSPRLIKVLFQNAIIGKLTCIDNSNIDALISKVKY